jgi:hypothetical protein
MATSFGMFAGSPADDLEKDALLRRHCRHI